MTTNSDDKRSIIISAESEEDLRQKMRKIPGYTRVELDDDLRRTMCLPKGEDRFYLQASNGERIVVRHKQGEESADTINIMNQDALDHPVPIHQDEVVKLHHAIKEVDGLSSCVVAAEIDLLPPSL